MTTAFDIAVEPFNAPSALADPSLFPAVSTAEQARDLVALHAAATLVPSAGLLQREQIRATWNAALTVVWEFDDAWAIAYLPGVHHGDNDTYAVHKDSGRVFGGSCPETKQDDRESTATWLARLTR